MTARLTDKLPECPRANRPKPSYVSDRLPRSLALGSAASSLSVSQTRPFHTLTRPRFTCTSPAPPVSSRLVSDVASVFPSRLDPRPRLFLFHQARTVQYVKHRTARMNVYQSFSSIATWGPRDDLSQICTYICIYTKQVLQIRFPTPAHRVPPPTLIYPDATTLR